MMALRRSILRCISIHDEAKYQVDGFSHSFSPTGLNVVRSWLRTNVPLVAALRNHQRSLFDHSIRPSPAVLFPRTSYDVQASFLSHVKPNEDVRGSVDHLMVSGGDLLSIRLAASSCRHTQRHCLRFRTTLVLVITEYSE